MTLRQLWVRLRALPGDSPVHAALLEESEREKEADLYRDVDAALTIFRKG